MWYRQTGAVYEQAIINGELPKCRVGYWQSQWKTAEVRRSDSLKKNQFIINKIFYNRFREKIGRKV